MTINPIAARAVAGSGPRSRKTKAFNALEPIIIEALTGGASVRRLYRDLREDGHEIGSETWFRTLVARLALKEGGMGPQTPTTPASPVITPPGAESEPRPFGDTRFASDY